MMSLDEYMQARIMHAHSFYIGIDYFEQLATVERLPGLHASHGTVPV